jgi:AraC-like DNA-binding protein
MARLQYGGGGEATKIICGFLGCEVPDNPLVATLPAVLRLSLRQEMAGAWMEHSFRLGVDAFATHRAGSGVLLSKLAELLFAEAVQGYLATLPDDQTGWLAGLRDPVVGKALALLHTRVAEPWTTERLAREVALSRSSFAERFTALIGTPPMRYLANWRMQLAKRLLRESGQNIAEVAAQVGYESEAAFNRAFRRLVGKPPAAWRDDGKRRAARPPFAVPGFGAALSAATQAW